MTWSRSMPRSCRRVVRSEPRPGHIGLSSVPNPYTIWGDIHALPGSDPIASFQHRPPMVPLTNSRIAYELGGVLGQFELGTLIVNS